MGERKHKVNVIFEISGTEYTVELKEAKHLLNEVYDEADSITVGEETIELDGTARADILKQLHGQIFI